MSRPATCHSPAEWRPPAASRETTVFLQFTSGSTAEPRGVVLTHDNLLHNQAAIRDEFRTTGESSVFGWLPLHHDMGLIGTVLHPVFMGIPCVLMSPAHFIERPIRWLRALSRYRSTISGGPNFAFDLCVRRTSIEERASLDLSAWTVAFNGAEPVRPADAAPLRVGVLRRRIQPRGLSSLLRPGRGHVVRRRRGAGTRHP